MGNLAIACTFFGLNITYSELGKTKEFAEYRFKKYGIDMPTQFSNKIEGMFDVIISLEVFEHLYDPVEHYKELLTHLNSGGYLIFTHSSHDIGRPEHLDMNLKYSGENAIKTLEELGLKRHQVIQYPFALYAKDDGTSNCEGGQITSLGTSVIHILRKE
jgi:2-polyprenyl-3-methyl-5-hydroxy-6-metoxy-1,4-benzoquinol methylase